MSNFNCDKCGKGIIDSENGYLNGCEHYPVKGFSLNCKIHGQVRPIEKMGVYICPFCRIVLGYRKAVVAPIGYINS